MSQSLVVFNASGKIHYQYNNKINPFNELVSSIVNETYHEIELNFFTTSSTQKRFYCLKRNKFYVALYFDVITTIDRDRIKQTLISIWKTYEKVVVDDNDQGKLEKLINYQVEQLMKFKQAEVATTAATGSVTGVTTGSSGVSSELPVASSPASAMSKNTGKKKMRKWNDNGEIEDIVNSSNPALDYSESKGEGSTSGYGNSGGALNIDQAAFKKENDLYIVNELNDILAGDDDNEIDEDDNGSGENSSGFFSKVSSYFGSSVPIDSLSKDFCNHLISKNISPPTATKITDKIKQDLHNQKVTKQTYKQALETELTKILTPNVSTDLLYQIKGRKSGSRPFVISVVGVNGVGKSTNLAKLAYWFLQNDLNVLICACDTFRSGAVEQLKVHVNNLAKLNSSNSSSSSKIELFENGYGGGDHVVSTAKLAIQYASGAAGFDIVLIDTAGRTHSNAKLMAPLKKFGDAANPDKIIMVGEALVGTDSVEQAQNFNNAFGNRRSLDFFIISKVDTVGDLVGAMINMVMATRVPILFVGTGQTYTDIKRLSVKRVVDMLMS